MYCSRLDIRRQRIQQSPPWAHREISGDTRVRIEKEGRETIVQCDGCDFQEGRPSVAFTEDDHPVPSIILRFHTHAIHNFIDLNLK